VGLLTIGRVPRYILPNSFSILREHRPAIILKISDLDGICPRRAKHETRRISQVPTTAVVLVMACTHEIYVLYPGIDRWGHFILNGAVRNSALAGRVGRRARLVARCTQTVPGPPKAPPWRRAKKITPPPALLPQMTSETAKSPRERAPTLALVTPVTS
jgi:hypothetical protein